MSTNTAAISISSAVGEISMVENFDAVISAEKYPHGVKVGISDDASKNEEERAATAVNDDHGDIVEGSEGDEGGKGSEEDLEEVESLAESIEEAFSSDDENTLGATAGLDSSVTETDTEAKAEAEAAAAGETAEYERTDAKAKGLSDE